MKRKKLTTEFWATLAMVNIIVLIYPFRLLHRAESADESLIATFMLIGCFFLLAVVDAVSIVVADIVGTGKR